MERFGEAGLLLALLASCLLDLRFLQLHFIHQVVGCHMGQRGVDKPVVRYVSGEVAQGAYESLRTGQNDILNPSETFPPFPLRPDDRKGEIVLDGNILEGDWKPDRGRGRPWVKPALNGFITSQKLGLTCLRPPPEPTKPRENVEMKLGCTCDSKRDMGKVQKIDTVETMDKISEARTSRDFLTGSADFRSKPFNKVLLALTVVVCIRMSTGHADMLVFC